MIRDGAGGEAAGETTGASGGEGEGGLEGGLIVLGRVGRPHGVKGWLKLNSFTSPPDNILEYRQFRVPGHTPVMELLLDAHSRSGGAILVHFERYDSPEEARQLTGLELAVPRSELPQLSPGEYYWHELQGLSVVNRQGVVFGTVARLLETGANDVLLIAPTANSVDRKERLIPYLPGSVVLSVELEKQLILVDWEPDYLD